MRITFELEPDDIARFRAALARAERLADCMSECDVLDAAKSALNALPIGGAPGYVQRRLVAVQHMILMLEDDQWGLPQPERTEVVRTLIYFADPDDLIPDDIAVIGLLDDAIMLELLLRRLRHVLDAYVDFCTFRRSQAIPVADDRCARGAALARKRDALRERMRRRMARGQSTIPQRPSP
ncbi:DUF1232 domain-containing protein [Tahibacter amnicola]|uniref:DUF1232 domain-containing protein n=1 Tax=Tahibacter amnicola TaxID=2976241 RepID=A0ABY6BET5_9GAMM|nr:DUF1232 domain-containing protein [Tahibacter amnicola]UXI66865.1 DUF1232 domain-containing protein [Tahibacter amnicola]